MNIGLGLPIDDPAELLTWARRADASPFRTLGLLDRLVYDNPEPLITLATLAGATSRIRVQTEVLLAPLHNTALLAKQTATLDRLSGGRYGDGFLGAALPPSFMSNLFRDAETAWQKHDRPGCPRLVAQANVALGPDRILEGARRNLRDYYAFSGHVAYMEAGLLTTPRQIREAADAYFGIGADEVMLYCWASDADQIDRLADALF
jgi:alkanesulfonate monooxygenase SsuD/methylene tetrahydromethanopterin reductase-like flavin-dependent oxidoreductase (luciferase family)